MCYIYRVNELLYAVPMGITVVFAYLVFLAEMR